MDTHNMIGSTQVETDASAPLQTEGSANAETSQAANQLQRHDHDVYSFGLLEGSNSSIPLESSHAALIANKFNVVLAKVSSDLYGVISEVSPR